MLPRPDKEIAALASDGDDARLNVLLLSFQDELGNDAVDPAVQPARQSAVGGYHDDLRPRDLTSSEQGVNVLLVVRRGLGR